MKKKGFHFKLEALLKVRKINEDKIKMEIGRLLVEKTNLLSQIDSHQDAIGQAYESQEVATQSGSDALSLRFYPYFVDGKRAHIDQLENQILDIDSKVDEKQKELRLARAKVKVLEKMKDKEKTKYKKALDKKSAEVFEDDVQRWFHAKNN